MQALTSHPERSIRSFIKNDISFENASLSNEAVIIVMT